MSPRFPAPSLSIDLSPTIKSSIKYSVVKWGYQYRYQSSDQLFLEEERLYTFDTEMQAKKLADLLNNTFEVGVEHGKEIQNKALRDLLGVKDQKGIPYYGDRNR